MLRKTVSRWKSWISKIFQPRRMISVKSLRSMSLKVWTLFWRGREWEWRNLIGHLSIAYASSLVVNQNRKVNRSIISERSLKLCHDHDLMLEQNDGLFWRLTSTTIEMCLFLCTNSFSETHLETKSWRLEEKENGVYLQPGERNQDNETLKIPNIVTGTETNLYIIHCRVCFILIEIFTERVL